MLLTCALGSPLSDIRVRYEWWERDSLYDTDGIRTLSRLLNRLALKVLKEDTHITVRIFHSLVPLRWSERLMQCGHTVVVHSCAVDTSLLHVSLIDNLKL